MKTGTYKLYRVKNHYHVVGEHCGHMGRKPRTPVKSSLSTHSRSYALGLVLWAVVAVLYLLVSPAVVTYAREPEPAPPVTPVEPETLTEKINRYADDAGIPRSKLHALVMCESSYNPKARNLSKVEDSRGIVQINLKAHDVSIAQAEDVDFSLRFAIDHWTKRKSMWYNCSIKHSL